MLDVSLLPDNSSDLKDIIKGLQNKHQKEIQEEKNKYLILEEQYLILQKKFFGRKSEKLPEDNGQPLLFNEAEFVSDIEENKEIEENITVKSHARKKKRKKTFPAHLPVKVETHDISEEDKKCSCCGKERSYIGSDETREIDIIPEQIRIIKHEQRKYGPCDCDGFFNKYEPEIMTAKKPKRLLPGIIASVGLLAYIFVNKFLDSLPFNRQENRFKRLGMEISRTNMCNWQISVSRKCQGLLDLMWKEIRSGPFIQMDETSCQVLKEPGRSPQSKGYMFVTIGYNKDHKPIVIYHYHRTRNKKIVGDILDGFKGYLQTDGLGIYNYAEYLEGIKRVACGAHLRRNFYEAAELCKKKKGVAHTALFFYGKISKIEEDLRKDTNLTNEEFETKRRELMNPILKEFQEFILEKKPLVPPQSKLGKALGYAAKEWSKWIRFLDKWYITPDNNYTERKVRAFVIGRKNWHFSDTLRGAHSSATMYTLVQSAKENGLNPYWYLRYIFVKLPYAETEEDLRILLPTEVTKQQLLDFQTKNV